MERFRQVLGGAWWKEIKVRFLRVKLTKKGIETLYRLSQTSSDGSVSFILLPNRYKESAKQPDYQGIVEYGT